MADIFLKLDGVKGESGDGKHPDEIQVDSFSWGGSNATSFEKGSGGGIHKGHIQDVHFTKTADFASLNLFQACISGEHIKTGVFTFRKAGKEQQEYLKIKLSECMVSSFSIADSGGDLPHESVSLAYAKVESEYKTQKKDGTLDKQSTFGWDITKNEPVK